MNNCISVGLIFSLIRRLLPTKITLIFASDVNQLEHLHLPVFSLKLVEKIETRNDDIQTIMKFTGVLPCPLLVHHGLNLCGCQENRNNLNLQNLYSGLICVHRYQTTTQKKTQKPIQTAEAHKLRSSLVSILV